MLPYQSSHFIYECHKRYMTAAAQGGVYWTEQAPPVATDGAESDTTSLDGSATLTDLTWTGEPLSCQGNYM